MSFFSTLLFLYPAPLPSMTVGRLRELADRLHAANLTKPQSRLTNLQLKYGDRIDCDYEELPDECDYIERDKEYAELWPSSTMSDKSLYRAYLSIGSLESSVSKSLTAMATPETTYEFIAPDQLSLSIGPAPVSTLESEEPTCFSLLSVSLSGNGFFSWQPLSAYWKSVRSTPTIQTVAEICREFLPVPEFERLESLKDDIGDLFLNYEGYRTGDWIVSIEETG